MMRHVDFEEPVAYGSASSSEAAPSGDAGACQLAVACRRVEKLPELPEATYEANAITSFKQEEEKLIAWNVYPNEPGMTAMLSLKGANASILVGPRTAGCSVLNMLMIALLPVVSCAGGMLIHASLIEFRGRAVAFTAASGTGKSTHADLWCRHLGAHMMNGDRAFLKRASEGWKAYGSPWAGSSPYVLNLEAPLAAVVTLAQAPENHIHPLGGPEVLSRLYNNVRYPFWDKDATSAALATFDALTREVPLFALDCLPNEDAARVCCQAVFGGGA